MIKVAVLCIVFALAHAEWFEESYAEHKDYKGSFETQYHPQFAGWSLEKIKGLMGLKQDKTPEELGATIYSDENMDAGALPATFNVATKWPKCNSTFGYIKDQAACGSCWAVSASSVIGGRVCIAQGGPDPNVPYNKNGRNLNENAPPIDYSSQQIMSCCKNCGDGCQGGYPLEAMRYVMDFGVVTGGWFNSQCGCYPYEIDPTNHVEGRTPRCQRRKCTNTKYGKSFNADKKKAYNHYQIANSATQIQNEIYNNGPVECGFDVYANFMHYKSGVYDHKSGSLLGGHAVTLYGWGTQSNKKYWLISNSWNVTWGMNGRFLFLRGTNLCGMEGQCVAAKFHKSTTQNYGLKC